MQFFGLDISGDHARLIFTAAGGAFAAAGFLAGRWTRHRSRQHFRREDLVTSTIIVEMYGIRRQLDGSDMLHIITQGGPSSIDAFFHSPDLVRRISREAGRHPGLIQLSDQLAHRMMMDEGKDAITGHDPRANMDFVHGRPTQDDETLFGFAAYAEAVSDNDDGLKNQVGRLVLMVVSPNDIERLASADYVNRLRVRHAGYQPKRQRLHDFANEWLRLSSLPHDQRSAATDCIWQVSVRTSRY